MSESQRLPNLILASASPRRKQLLEQIGVNFSVMTVQIDESSRANESPLDYVQRMGWEKAMAGLASRQQLLPVLGADTIVVIDGQILGKPKDFSDAQFMLERLSGSTHQVITAVTLASDRHCETVVNKTTVTFRELQSAEISHYWQTGEPRDKAGAYGIQGYGAIFVENIHGSYSGVVGLPILETIALLKKFSIPWWQHKVAN